MTRGELDGLVAAGVLTEVEADVIWLHDVKGLSYRAIALERRRAMQTVFGQAKRGHEKIRVWRKEAA